MIPHHTTWFAYIRVGAVFLVTVLFCAMFVLLKYIYPPAITFFIRPLNKIVLRLLNVKLSISGVVTTGASPILFVSNHASYLDICALFIALPAYFVSKADVRQWPLFGWLTETFKTIYIKRTKGSTAKGAATMEERFNQGDNLILFPEGTSTDGNQVLPFNSSYFAPVFSEAIVRKPVVVQPVTIAYHQVNARPSTHSLRAHVTWWGDKELVSHMLEIASLHSMGIHVHIHPPLENIDLHDRKTLSQEAHGIVAAGLQSLIA